MKEKRFLIVIGILIFIVIAGGVSYSFFVYNKEVADVSLTTGDISIRLANINGNLNLNNAIPKSNSEGMASTDYVDFTVNATVDTEKIYYEVYILPKTGNTLNTNYLKTYLTDQTNVAISNVATYGSLSTSQVAGGKVIYRGIIELNNNYSTKNETKNFRLRLWLDDDYPELSSKVFDFDLYLYAKNVSEDFTLDPPICKRAETLHTESCEQSSNYCAADNYALHANITYGNLGTSGQMPQVGDAFDCNVDGTGYNQRFYYVSDYYNASTNTFDPSTGVLVYYSHTYNSSGVSISYNGAYYDSGGANWNGPVTALTHLPTTEGWSNVELKTTSRNISSCGNAECSSSSLTTGSGVNTLNNPFSYSGHSARLLTLQELKRAGCDNLSLTEGLSVAGSLKACNFLLEGTKYANSSKATYGMYLENPYSSDSASIWVTNAEFRNLNRANDTTYGVRPVIDVPMYRIEY